MKKDNQPIVLSGSVFVDKLLAAEHPSMALPDRVNRGDVKVIALMHSRASGKPTRARVPVQPFAGFFSAYVFDGNQWRKFAIRAAAAKEATYANEGERRSRILNVVAALKKLRGATAVWGNRAFEVHNPVTFAHAEPPIKPVPPPASTAQVAATPSPVTPAAKAARTGKAEQLKLF